jgi:hypothetical protein
VSRDVQEAVVPTVSRVNKVKRVTGASTDRKETRVFLGSLARREGKGSLVRSLVTIFLGFCSYVIVKARVFLNVLLVKRNSGTATACSTLKGMKRLIIKIWALPVSSCR